MDTETLPVFGTNIDRSQVPPIHQKRILAFVNHFLVNTITFLNKFVTNCETKFINFERKLQRIEASLLIVEGKIASINGNESVGEIRKDTAESNDINSETIVAEKIVNSTINEVIEQNTSDSSVTASANLSDSSNKIKASDHVTYRKYFKMLQFGVPPQAVKLKMSSEGIDSNILDDPDKLFEVSVNVDNESD